MKEKKDIVEERTDKRELPVLRISVTNLEITVEEGRVYHSSFVIESENKVPVQGIVRSTNDKIGLEKADFAGTHIEIPYYFKGKLATAGNEFEGDFLLITNAGEYNIPYRVVVTPVMAETSIGRICQMEDFVKLYHENRQEAMELFFLPNFSSIFLKHLPEQDAMYHSLMKSRSRNMIVEEFLSAAGWKEPAALAIEEKQVVLDAGKDRGEITLILTADGYVEGTISSEKGQVQISAGRFTSADFKDGRMKISIEKNHSYAVGSDRIRIRTVRQEICVPVEWWGTLPPASREREIRSRVKKQKAELMHNYLFFRTGSIGFEDFAEESDHVLDELYHLTRGTEWRLYKIHLLIMEEHQEEAEELFHKIEDEQQDKDMEPLLENYFLYLKAMLYRTPETISGAVLSIRDFYEVSPYKAEALWMLIYLDREYVYNKRLQYDTIRQLFQEGKNSSLLFFEACEILNENPNFMEELGSFEVSIFRCGVRYGYISMSLAYQFARLALRMKYYSNAIFHIAKKLYEIEPDERFLQVICSLLIKGNRYGEEYHEYFRKAVNANLKIVGLNEFFIRSMDFGSFEVIPHRVLIYFTYSNSLDSLEKAYLYSNVLENKEACDEVFGAYYSKMIPFVEEQLLKGRMNEHLAYLYHYFQKEILEKPANTKAVCDILFYRKIICHNRNMIGVYVSRPETGEEIYYPLSGGFCYAEIPTSRARLYFVDSNEQRYVTGIPYEEEPFLFPEQFPKEWIQKNMANKRILLSLSDKIDGELKGEDMPILQKIAFHEDYQPWIKCRAVERMLLYYQQHQEKESLARWLDRVDYSNVTPEFRKTLMDFYMEVGMTENAFFGIELYGCNIMGAAKRLRLASFGVNYNESKMDETTLYLAYSAFVSKKYNRDTLSYLMKHFEGELEDLLLIWERSRKFALETTELEKRMLRQSMFTGNDADGLFTVFEEYYSKNREDAVAGEYLQYASDRERRGILELPESVHGIIGEEILAGRIRDRQTMVHFLYYFAPREAWMEKVKDAAKFIIEKFLKEEYYLPVYYAYREWLTLPVEYLERTFLTYHGSGGSNVVLYYQVEGENTGVHKKRLKEILPGMYTCTMYFYHNDHVNYRLEDDGEVVSDEAVIRFETFESEGEESRLFALNDLSAESCAPEELNRYLLQTYFTDTMMKLL